MSTIVTYLDHTQYDMQTLIDNIETISLLKIVRKQKLTLEFIKDYILNEKYQTTVEETCMYISPDDLED